MWLFCSSFFRKTDMDEKIFNVRLAEVKDSDRILDLLKQVLDVHRNGRPDLFKESDGKYSIQELTDIINDRNKPIFVAVDSDNSVVGYCFCIIQRNTGSRILADIKTLYIDDLCVDASLRGRHIGHMLYRYAVEYAKSISCYNVTLNVWSLNSSAIKFYESLGMKPQKIGMEQIL